MSTDESSRRPSEPEAPSDPQSDRNADPVRVARGSAEVADPQRSLRRLPKVDEELRRPELQAADVPRWALLAAVRESIEALRQELRRGVVPEGREDPGAPGLRLHPAQVLAAARRRVRPSLRRVINATGVVLHTNLGRAPLPARSLQRIAEAAEGYCNLEYQHATGQRGSRQDLLPELLRPLTGAEAHLVVNNNAAAVLLMLAGLCAGRKVVVSRGELVEIGGSFRVPDVMQASGAILCEVGTTNRTHRRDYESAADGAAAFLKVHRGNFAIVGFVAEVGAAELAAMAHERGLLCLYDLGSGALLIPDGAAASGGARWSAGAGEDDATAAAEPTVPQAIAAGCDVVSFSCDKLLGGPQAGVLCGAAAAVRPLHKHPLMRALRPDKLTLAALLGALELYRDGRHDEIPVLRMLCESATSLRARAERLLDRIRALGIEADVIAVRSAVGGGAMPLWQPQSYAVALRGGDTQARIVESALRRGDPEVIARIESGRLLFDVRTIAEAELAPLAAALRCAASPR